MPNLWVTSDWHLNHKNILNFTSRPYSTVEEMNEGLIENYNKVVKPGDLVYHLGDFAFSDPEPFLKRLNGQKYFIFGNHDKDYRKYYETTKHLVWARDAAMIKYNEQEFWLAHYAHRVWNKSHYGCIHLFGHSHGNLPDYGRSCDVGVDAWNCAPVNYDQLIDRFKDVPAANPEARTKSTAT